MIPHSSHQLAQLAHLRQPILGEIQDAGELAGGT
jgi:hypothetical protein